MKTSAAGNSNHPMHANCCRHPVKQLQYQYNIIRPHQVRWMCGVKLKERLPSKELRERLGIDDSSGITAEQAALVWACAAKRRR